MENKNEKISNEEKEQLITLSEQNGGSITYTLGSETFTLTADHVKFERYTETHIEEKYIPGVIEPSFGMGRITYCVLEHSFGVREKDARRTFFDFPPVVAPYKVSVLPLIHSDELLQFVEPISNQNNS